MVSGVEAGVRVEAVALILYLVTAAVLLWLAHRFAVPLSRFAAPALLLIPFCFTGRAILTNRVLAPIDIPYETEPLNWMRAQTGIIDVHNSALSDVASAILPY